MVYKKANEAHLNISPACKRIQDSLGPSCSKAYWRKSWIKFQSVFLSLLFKNAISAITFSIQFIAFCHALKKL